GLHFLTHSSLRRSPHVTSLALGGRLLTVLWFNIPSAFTWYVEPEKGALYLVNRGDKAVDYLDLKTQDPDKIDWSENNMNSYHFKPDTEPEVCVPLTN
ncbi:hypothetical protein Tco_1396191, partial [Tanacetum coccineum]